MATVLQNIEDTRKYSTVQYSTDFTTVQVHFSLGTGHNLAGGVGRWKQWGGGVTYFLARKKGGS